MARLPYSGWPLVFTVAALAVPAAAEDRVDVFTSGTGGYHSYRIPALV